LKPGSTILIAGSRQGLGRALAEHYAKSGHNVFGLSRNESDLIHPRYRHICADVAREDTLKQAFICIGDAGSLDVLIYSAGISAPGYALLTRGAQAEEVFRTNLLGAFLVTRHALRLMKRGGFGRLIFLSSIAVPLGSSGSVAYGASKAGLEQMAYSLSREFAQDDITFNSLGISIFDSPMLQLLSEQALREVRASLVKSKNLELDEVVGAIDFLSSRAARQITGQTIYFGGVR
jgi:3-oxoacyl-[acyl-carrier protein] reductase